MSSMVRAFVAARRPGCCTSGTVFHRWLTLLSNMFTDLNLTDMETGFKVFRRSVLGRIDLREERLASSQR